AGVQQPVVVGVAAGEARNGADDTVGYGHVFHRLAAGIGDRVGPYHVAAFYEVRPRGSVVVGAVGQHDDIDRGVQPEVEVRVAMGHRLVAHISHAIRRPEVAILPAHRRPGRRVGPRLA